MQSIITDYFLLPCDKFATLLEECNGYIGGGSVLQAFRDLPLIEGQDLDCFVTLPFNHDFTPVWTMPRASDSLLWNAYRYARLVELSIDSFMRQYGYTPLPKPHDSGYTTVHYARVVTNVVSYVKTNAFGNERKVQFVFTYNMTPAENCAEMDLNCCKFISLPESKFLTIESPSLTTEEREEIARGCARVTLEYFDLQSRQQRKLLKRILKYQDRGMVFLRANGDPWWKVPARVQAPYKSHEARLRFKVSSSKDVIFLELVMYGCFFEGSDCAVVDRIHDFLTHPMFRHAPSMLIDIKYVWDPETKTVRMSFTDYHLTLDG